MEPLKSSDPSVLGDWRIMGRLGEGGFGTVYLAEKGAQKAAIKVIKSEFVEEGDARARLATEAEVLSKLSNPYIGKILDSDVNSDLPWIATEFINGPTLDNKVKYEGPLTEIEWFNLAANLFHAIVAANELGVIHKDIKPSNIILGETGNKLIDFGIAHIEGRTKTVVFGDREGSTPFSSPEHFTPRANPKMDVFSAASTLAFAGKAKSVWVGENDLQLMRSINDDEPDLTGLTQNQINFLTPLFEKNPSDRPSAISTKLSAHDYIEFLLGNKKHSEVFKNKHVRTDKKRLELDQSEKSRFTSRWGYSRYAIVGILSTGLITLFSNIFGIYFWTILFLIFPLWAFWVTQKTYRRGIGAKKWGHRNIPRTLVVLVASSLLPILVLFLSLYSAATIPIDVKLFVNQLLSQEIKDSTATKKNSFKVKTIISIETKALNEAANSFFYKGEYKKSLESAQKSANLGNAEGMYLAGRAAEALQDIELAISWFQKGSDNNYANASFAGGVILIQQKRNVEAERELKKAIDLGSTEALTALASHYLQIDQIEKAGKLFEASIDQGDLTATIIYADFLKQSGKSSEALEYFLKASKAGESFGSLGAGVIYGKNSGTLKQAKKYYQLSIDQGLIEGNFFLGEILKKEGNFIAAKNAYLVSAEIDGGFSAISLATLFGEKLGDVKSACGWAQKVKTLKNVDQSESNEALALSQKYCTKTTTSPVATSSTSPKSKVKVVESQKPTPKPIASSDSFKVSVPLDSNVEVDEIFGRAFKNGLNYWVVPLTTIKGAKVPEVTGIQFRLIGYPDAGWLGVPYKLKTDSSSEIVYAEVDDILFALIFKDQKYCPEFRAIREENGKIVRIWNKGQPDCATDYNP